MSFYVTQNKKMSFALGIILSIFLVDFVYRNLFVSLTQLLCSLLLSFGGKIVIYRIIDVYRDFLGYTTVGLFRFFRFSAQYISKNNCIQLSNHQYIISNQLGYLKLFYFFILLFVFPLGIRKSSIILGIGCIVICLFLSFRFLYLSLGCANERLILTAFDCLYDYLLITFVFYKIRIQYSLRKVYVMFDKELRLVLSSYSLSFIIIILASYTLISELLVSFMAVPITSGLLHISAFIMNICGYTSTIYLNTLHLHTSTVIVGESCLGVRLMLLYCTVLIFMKGNTFRKSLFIVIGLQCIFLFNVLRISFLLYHLDHYGNQCLTMNIHTTFDFCVYGFCLILWGWFYVGGKWKRF